jgi:hypothetical protein
MNFGKVTSLKYLNTWTHFICWYMTICICLSLPVTFQYVSTWLRSTMGKEHLFVLCTMSVYKEQVKKIKVDFVEKLV